MQLLVSFAGQQVAAFEVRTSSAEIPCYLRDTDL